MDNLGRICWIAFNLKEKMINRQEAKYILYSGIFAFVWFIFLLPIVVKMFDGNNAFIQFLIFTGGLFFFFFLFLKSITTAVGFNIKTSLGLLALFLSFDIFLPEYHVLTSGQLIQGATLGISASDYAAGLLAQTLGLSGFLVYAFTYVLVPLVLLFLSARFLPNFVRHV